MGKKGKKVLRVDPLCIFWMVSKGRNRVADEDESSRKGISISCN